MFHYDENVFYFTINVIFDFYQKYKYLFYLLLWWDRNILFYFTINIITYWNKMKINLSEWWGSNTQFWIHDKYYFWCSIKLKKLILSFIIMS